jgi:hypothetical protein
MNHFYFIASNLIPLFDFHLIMRRNREKERRKSIFLIFNTNFLNFNFFSVKTPHFKTYDDWLIKRHISMLKSLLFVK